MDIKLLKCAFSGHTFKKQEQTIADNLVLTYYKCTKCNCLDGKRLLLDVIVDGDTDFNEYVADYFDEWVGNVT